MEYFTEGQDIGLNIAGVKIGYHEDRIYVVKDHGGHYITTKTFNDPLTLKGWFEDDFPVYCDLAGGERIQEITGGIEAKNAVDSGLDSINSLIEHESSTHLQNVPGFFLKYGITPGMKMTS